MNRGVAIRNRHRLHQDQAVPGKRSKAEDHRRATRIIVGSMVRRIAIGPLRHFHALTVDGLLHGSMIVDVRESVFLSTDSIVRSS
ncbi:hypothetical protein [Burkholderia cepacia]|uniref:hypothetical protein n=1 Tax=Burkholderia cepacia TaxID=292 RepID=UPI0012D9A161|nr:hypothetical protein [Burkholderia cepacia]